jgi:hypothetical protein
MTDLIERLEGIGSEPILEPGQTHSSGRAGEREARPPSADFGLPGRVLLAVLLGCSAILSFAVAAPHFSGWRFGAIALVVTAWAQIVAVVAGLVRPSRSLFRAVAVLSIATGGLWATVLTGHHGVSAFAGDMGVALSGAAFVIALTLALRPTIGAAWSSSTFVMSSLIPVAVVVLTMTALSFPATAAAPPSRTAASPPTTPNPFFNSVRVPGQGTARFLQIASGNDTEKAELRPWVPLDPATQAVLSGQLHEAAQAAMRFPTVADAKKAGMILAGGMAPGVGAHYQLLSASALQGVNPDGSINPAHPGSWIYGCIADNCPIVGIMYESFNAAAPTGFAGPNDHWHQHSNLCITYSQGKIGVPFAPDTSVTPAQCATAHGQFLKKTLWMVHAWVVPGWESPLGVFSHSNPHVYCPGNTDLTDHIGFCLRQS